MCIFYLGLCAWWRWIFGGHCAFVYYCKFRRFLVCKINNTYEFRQENAYVVYMITLGELQSHFYLKMHIAMFFFAFGVLLSTTRQSLFYFMNATIFYRILHDFWSIFLIPTVLFLFCVFLYVKFKHIHIFLSKFLKQKVFKCWFATLQHVAEGKGKLLHAYNYKTIT